ncbi:MAG: fasciclin domain-containing protein [Thiocapsa sp.]|jgi:uncharacterized surface protein with fasciclin (FAS1) repeats|nr:fasciclin domain-containing protein [Thiocapsa sp.]MCG6896044.1 fasciclin domain-containing protein [Thiocapsa sp.]MCG6986347.1 fasciclin domain-containing protein [Thiocapsa sp.]
MSNERAPGMSPLTIALGLAITLGPLTALSFGSRYAGEETMERARAGLVNAKPSDPFAGYDSTRTPGYGVDKSLADITGGAAIFSQLQSAIKVAGAEAMLRGDGPYTVFAPSNDAFARLPQERLDALMTDPAALRDVIAAHVVPGRLSATDMMQGRTATTLAGHPLQVGVEGHLKVADATVTQSIVANNGIVHVIDRLML